MKFLILSSLLISSTAFAQSIDVNGFKTLLTQKKATLEKVNVGMSKKVVTTSKAEAENGEVCEYTQTAVQTILRIEGAKMIVHSKEALTLVPSPACTALEFQNYEETVVFYQDKPSVAADIAVLDEAGSDIRSIIKSGELVTMKMEVSDTDEAGNNFSDSLTFKYDLTKPSFKSLISTEGQAFKTLVQDQADVDVNKIDLRKVTFCANDDADSSDCVEGDFSDILF